MLKTRGFNHVDLGTKDMEATRTFYEDVLGFPLVRADLVEIGDNGRMKHFFFDVGNGQLIGFMSGEDVGGYPKDFDSGINKGLGLARGVYDATSDRCVSSTGMLSCRQLPMADPQCLGSAAKPISSDLVGAVFDTAP